MITGIDHVVILVEDLGASMERYGALGFTVERGGQHPGAGTENALIPLADGAYLELLAVRDRLLAARHRLWQRADGRIRAPGEFGGFMVGTDHLDQDATRLQLAGVTLAEQRAGSRLRPDGEQVRWRLVFPERRELPALIEDETPRAARVPAPVRGMCLGTRLDEVAIMVPDVRDSAAVYARLLGRQGDGAPGARARGEAWFHTAAGGVRLFEPEAGSAARADLKHAGPGIDSATLMVEKRRIDAPALRAVIENQRGARTVDLSSVVGARLFVRIRGSEA